MTTAQPSHLARSRGRASRTHLSALACMLVVVAGPPGCGVLPDDAGGTSSSGTSGGATTTSATASGAAASSVDPSTSSIGDASSSSGVSSADSGSSSATGGPVDCEARNPEFDCPPVDCADPPLPQTDPPIPYGGCGGNNVFDDDGCMRPWCRDDQDCSAGERCFWPPDCDPTLEIGPNGCYAPSPVSECYPNPPMPCLCLPRDCSHDGWCVPADQGC